MPMKSLFFILSLLPFLLPGQTSNGLRAGAAVRIITPDPLLPISGGVGVPKDVKEKKGDLTSGLWYYKKEIPR